MSSFDYDDYRRALEAETDPTSAREMALALHETFESPAGVGHELNCCTCATWPDENTPARDPKPSDECWRVAAALLRALRPK